MLQQLPGINGQALEAWLRKSLVFQSGVSAVLGVLRGSYRPCFLPWGLTLCKAAEHGVRGAVLYLFPHQGWAYRRRHFIPQSLSPFRNNRF